MSVLFVLGAWVLLAVVGAALLAVVLATSGGPATSRDARAASSSPCRAPADPSAALAVRRSGEHEEALR